MANLYGTASSSDSSNVYDPSFPVDVKENSENTDSTFSSVEFLDSENDLSDVSSDSEVSEVVQPRSSRKAELHKRMKNVVNERLEELQRLIPNSNRTDKVLMLDEAIVYMTNLELHVEWGMREALRWHLMHSRGAGQPMFLPPTGMRPLPLAGMNPLPLAGMSQLPLPLPLPLPPTGMSRLPLPLPPTGMRLLPPSFGAGNSALVDANGVFYVNQATSMQQSAFALFNQWTPMKHSVASFSNITNSETLFGSQRVPFNPSPTYLPSNSEGKRNHI